MLEYIKYLKARHFKMVGCSPCTLLPSLTFPLPEETRRKFLRLEKMRRETEGEAMWFTTALYTLQS